MTRVRVELSGESLPLARAECDAAAEALGGRGVGPYPGYPSVEEVEVPPSQVSELATRLALARRCLLPIERGSDGAGGPGERASFRRLGRPSGGGTDPAVRAAATVWKSTGGTIDLDHPTRRFWLLGDSLGDPILHEEVGRVDRPALARHRISALPFQRPIGLDPRLARAAANLARVTPGARVVDPFLGTGALLAEAALLGARTVGVDRDATMVRGALRNFAYWHLEPEQLVVADAGSVDIAETHPPFDALLTDPPYGRGSGTGGEVAADLVAKVIPRWAEHVRVGGYAVVVVPGGPDPLGPPWERLSSVAVRVHRSLTREFRVFRRRA